MSVLVTGVSGQLGYDVVRELSRRGVESRGVSSRDMDITDKAEVRAVVNAVKPETVVHCAAYTKVDLAEDHPREAEAVNAYGTRYLAEAAHAVGADFMYFSTDYVFDGTGTRPHRPGDPVSPIGVYGRTKLMGEEAVADIYGAGAWILRLQWVYGINGHNFVRTMLKLAETHDTLTVVNDQIGTPSYTVDIAALVADMIETDKYGTYHVANTGYISWYDFACAIFEEAGTEGIRVIPVTSAEYVTRAQRPMNSRMDTSLLNERGFRELPHWHDALVRYMAELRDREPELFLPGGST